MNVVLTIVLAVQMLTALGMIGLILLQHGTGADMVRGLRQRGASGSLFRRHRQRQLPLSRTTAVLARRVLRLHARARLFSHSVKPVSSAACWSATAPAAPSRPAPRAPRRPDPRYFGPRHGARRAGRAASGAAQIPTK